MRNDIRAIVMQHGHLGVASATLPDDGDLYEAGLTSHASVNLMLALENHFDVEFPERMLRRRTFESIATIQSALQELTGVREPGALPRGCP